MYPTAPYTCSDPFQPDPVATDPYYCSPFDKEYCFTLGTNNALFFGLTTMIDCDCYYYCIDQRCWNGFGFIYEQY